MNKDAFSTATEILFWLFRLLHAYVCLLHMCLMILRSEDGAAAPRTGVMDVRDPPFGSGS